MDDRSLFRFKPDYRVPEMEVALDWSGYAGQGRGFQGAVEMCNNNGECRKTAGGVMCPSFRVTGNERDVTRGRANALRLAISGQLGPGAFASDDMLETMKLCVSCKACRRECPTGVDMAKMKIEVLAAANARRGLSLRDRLVAYLPRYAPYAARLAPLLNARDAIPGAARVGEWLTGFAARRPLPRWRRDRFRAPHRDDGDGVRDAARGAWDGAAEASGASTRNRAHAAREGAGEASRDAVRRASRDPAHSARSAARESATAALGSTREVALLADTFNAAFEPQTLRDAVALLGGLGYRVEVLAPRDGGRALCCGRTFLAAGLVNEARAELSRLEAAAAPFVARGVPVVGLEPSCLFTLRDEALSLAPGPQSAQLASKALLLEEFLAGEAEAGRIAAPIGRSTAKVLLHGHCHQKAFGAMGAIERALALVEGLEVETVESGCCGMAGAFGYQTETFEVSMTMGELALLPAVRKAAPDTLIAADGFSCRHQIKDGAGRTAAHVAAILWAAVRDTRGAAGA
jgi:Fe-S oxidoreductase